MTWLFAFGMLAASAVLLWCTLWSRRPFVVLTVAALCTLTSIHRFMHGAWLLGVLEAVWAVFAIRHWLRLTSGVPVKS